MPSLRAELPPLLLALNVRQIAIDGFDVTCVEASLHGYDSEQSNDSHVYLILHEIDPPPPPFCKRIVILYPKTEHDSEIETVFEIESFMQMGPNVVFKCNVDDPEFEQKLLRMVARPVLEVQEALDD